MVHEAPQFSHDALDDALSVSYTLQHLLRAVKLRPEVFEPV
jgi:hypothetical protein